jgi:hypothetical protein
MRKTWSTLFSPNWHRMHQWGEKQMKDSPLNLVTSITFPWVTWEEREFRIKKLLSDLQETNPDPSNFHLLEFILEGRIEPLPISLTKQPTNSAISWSFRFLLSPKSQLGRDPEASIQQPNLILNFSYINTLLVVKCVSKLSLMLTT